jgi:hypothetical protein
MKGRWILIAVIAMLAPGLSQAYTKTIICDGCSEATYTKAALRFSDDADAVLVVDAANAQLRKYRISSFADSEMNFYRKTALKITPSAKEWTLFDDTVKIYEQISYYLDSCGPGGGGDWLVPDFTFAAACERHDQCYSSGGTDDDRKECDRQLYRDMRAIGATHGLAAAYYLAVRAAGWMYFSFHGINTSSSLDPFGDCAYFQVCNYVTMAEIPR